MECNDDMNQRLNVHLTNNRCAYSRFNMDSYTNSLHVFQQPIAGKR